MKTKMPIRNRVGSKEGDGADPAAPRAGRLELDQVRRQRRQVDAVVLQRRKDVGVGRQGRPRIGQPRVVPVVDGDLLAIDRLDQLGDLAVPNVRGDVADRPERRRVGPAVEQQPGGEHRHHEDQPDGPAPEPFRVAHRCLPRRAGDGKRRGGVTGAKENYTPAPASSLIAAGSRIAT
jgi:hypothetical protein